MIPRAGALLGALTAQGGGGGFQAPNEKIFQFAPVFTVAGFGVTKPMLMAVFGALVVLGGLWAAFGNPKVVPTKFQALAEQGYLFVRDEIARGVIGEKGDRYMPLLVSLFFFVWCLNIFAFIPLLQFPVTGRIAYPASIAMIVWVTYMFIGMRNQGPIGFFRNMAFPPGVPKGLYVLLAPIELLSNIIVRPFTLAVRLFANMFAGHLLVVMFSVAAWYFLVEDFGVLAFVGVGGLVMTIVMSLFELLIQFLQAFIITLLTAVYISSSLEAEH
jgi:F-type H+-transporting ATPase subunit a